MLCLATGVLAGTILGGSLLTGQVKTPSRRAARNDLVSRRGQERPARRRQYRAALQTRRPRQIAASAAASREEMQKFFKEFSFPGSADKQLPEELRKFFEDSPSQPHPDARITAAARLRLRLPRRSARASS